MTAVQQPPPQVRPIRVVFERDEPLHYNTTKTADKLGMSRQHLTELATQKVDGKPTVYAPSGKSGVDNIYHIYQIKLISLVMRKKLTVEQASQFWRDIENHEIMDAINSAKGNVSK